MKKFIDKIPLIAAVSSRESDFLSAVQKEISPSIKSYFDKMGNFIVHKPGNGTKKLLIVSSVDTIGFFATFIEPNGHVRIAPSNPEIKLSDFVGAKVISGNIEGKICSENDENKLSDLYIDIDTNSTHTVQIGDVFSVVSNSDNILKGRNASTLAITAVMLMAIYEITAEYDLYFAFATCGIPGGRGAKTIGYSISPDAAIVLRPIESDFHLPCILARDGFVLSDVSLYERALKISESSNVPFRLAISEQGRRDAMSLSVSGHGTPTLSIALSVQNLGTSKEDIPEDNLKEFFDLIYNISINLLK